MRCAPNGSEQIIPLRKIDLAERPGDRSRTGVLPAALRGRWCLLTLRMARTGQGVPRIVLDLDTPSGQQIDAFPRRVGWSGRFWTLMFVPAEADKVRFEILGAAAAPADTTLYLGAVSRPVAAVLLAISHPLAVLRAGTGGRLGLCRRLRAMLAMMAAAGGAPRSYQLWVALFDTWSSDDLQRLLASSHRPAWPLVAAMVLTTDETSAATRATLASLRAQAVPVQARLVAPGSDGSAMDDDAVAYVAILPGRGGAAVSRRGIAL